MNVACDQTHARVQHTDVEREKIYTYTADGWCMGPQELILRLLWPPSSPPSIDQLTANGEEVQRREKGGWEEGRRGTGRKRQTYLLGRIIVDSDASASRRELAHRNEGDRGCSIHKIQQASEPQDAKESKPWCAARWWYDGGNDASDGDWWW